jgi:hypothetical protein
MLYLFAIIGLLAPLHKHHDSIEAHNSHTDCQLCQVNSGVYLAPVEPVCLTESPNQFDLLTELNAPLLIQRHSSFSPRGPPVV